MALALETVNVSDNASRSQGAAVAAGGSNVYVAWADDATGNFEIFFRKSKNGGLTWLPTQRITRSSGDAEDCRIAASGSNVYIIWEEDLLGSDVINFKRSADGGATWKPAIKLSASGSDSEDPVIAVSGSKVYVAWAFFDLNAEATVVYFRASDDGATWQPARLITPPLTTTPSIPSWLPRAALSTWPGTPARPRNRISSSPSP
jgi:hypothetical protein